MQLDLTDVERLALVNLPTKSIESDRYPLWPRIPTLRGILAKFGPMGPAQARPARSPKPEERASPMHSSPRSRSSGLLSILTARDPRTEMASSAAG
jgi:hypothetical protein